MKRTILFIPGTVFIVILISFFLMACEQLVDDKLPSAEDIIEKYLKATGGQKAHEKIQNQRAEYKVDVKASGMEVDFTYYQERPKFCKPTRRSKQSCRRLRLENTPEKQSFQPIVQDSGNSLTDKSNIATAVPSSRPMQHQECQVLRI